MKCTECGGEPTLHHMYYDDVDTNYCCLHFRCDDCDIVFKIEYKAVDICQIDNNGGKYYQIKLSTRVWIAKASVFIINILAAAGYCLILWQILQMI